MFNLFKKKKAKLVLSNGRVFEGDSISVRPEVNNTASIIVWDSENGLHVGKGVYIVAQPL